MRIPRSNANVRIRASLGPVWVLAALVAGCAGGEETAEERGRRAYVANCTACHHPNPALDGTLGPAVAGSSRALLEARVLGAEYPPGYTPKRDTGLMVPLPYLAPQLDDLAAYLAARPGPE